MAWTSNDVLRCSMIITILMAVKFWISTVYSGSAKHKAGMRAPEDKTQNQNPTADDIATAERAQRVVQNDLENVPIGLILIWGAALCIASDSAIAYTNAYESYHGQLRCSSSL
jgi:hypothetical protein